MLHIMPLNATYTSALYSLTCAVLLSCLKSSCTKRGLKVRASLRSAEMIQWMKAERNKKIIWEERCVFLTVRVLSCQIF